MFIAIAIIVLLLVLAAIGMYNALISMKNQVENVFGSVDVHLKKRYDLIPNLIATVKQYASHEKELLERITDLRVKALDSGTDTEKRIDIENRLTSAMGALTVAVENYPDLKASENFRHLQQTMFEIEEQLSAARRAYNATVTTYNNGIEMFPTNIMAGIMGYKRKKVFEASEVERQNINAENLFQGQ
ncbi:MAG: LemA family protein [Spirochaetota bacterium]